MGTDYQSKKHWQDFIAQKQEGDELVRYSDVDVTLGWASGEEGVALMREGELIAKIALSIIG